MDPKSNAKLADIMKRLGLKTPAPYEERLAELADAGRAELVSSMSRAPRKRTAAELEAASLQRPLVKHRLGRVLLGLHSKTTAPDAVKITVFKKGGN